jgi:hypothetical protein
LVVVEDQGAEERLGLVVFMIRVRNYEDVFGGKGGRVDVICGKRGRVDVIGGKGGRVDVIGGGRRVDAIGRRRGGSHRTVGTEESRGSLLGGREKAGRMRRRFLGQIE